MEGTEDRRARLTREALPLLPAALTIAVAVIWAATGGGYESQPTLAGGYDPAPWYLGALAIVGVSLTFALAIPRVRATRITAVAIGLFAAYVAWSYLSILWAHDQAAALHGSDRALVYLAAFALFALLPWRAWTVHAALTLLVAGLGALAIVTAVRIAVAADPSSLFLEGRLIYPLGYYNADAALFTITAFLAIALAARREMPAALRVAAVVIASVCLQLAVLGQSRGWLFTLPLMAIVALVIVPGRLRLIAFALMPAAAVGAITPILLRVYSSATVNGLSLTMPRLGHVLHDRSSHAAKAMLIADVMVALLAAITVACDRRLTLTRRAQRRVNLLAVTACSLALLGGLAAGIAATDGHPLARVESAWRSFANTKDTPVGASRFTRLGSERVDMWRVALHEYARHPLLGLGQDNFAPAYLKLRRTDQEPRWAHSVELRLLVHTGLVGALLFALFLLATALAAWLGTRGRPAERIAASAALLALVVWLVYGSIDWFWEFPALSVPALAFAGAATALGSPSQGRGPRARGGPYTHSVWRSGSVLARVGAGLAGAAALAALAIPFVAARETQRALHLWPTQPARAYGELRAAKSLVPFDAQTDLVGGAIALNSEDRGAAGEWLTKAEHVETRGWLAPFLLGLLYGEERRLAAARRELTRAGRANPREPLIATALGRLSSASPLSFEEAQTQFNDRRQARFGR
jgi:hypothetical protein